MWGSLIFHFIPPFHKILYLQPKSCRLFYFMCGTGGNISPRKEARSLQRHERKTTKRKDNGLTEREAENRCNARDAKWNHRSVFPSTFQPPQSVNGDKLFGYLKIQSVELDSRWSKHEKQPITGAELPWERESTTQYQQSWTRQLNKGLIRKKSHGI